VSGMKGMPGPSFSVKESSKFRIQAEFEFDKRFIALTPAIAINLHAGEFEVVWLCFGLYIRKS